MAVSLTPFDRHFFTGHDLQAPDPHVPGSVALRGQATVQHRPLGDQRPPQRRAADAREPCRQRRRVGPAPRRPSTGSLARVHAPLPRWRPGDRVAQRALRNQRRSTGGFRRSRGDAIA